MKTKAEILESHIHPTKYMSSLSTETGKMAIFNAMDEHAKQMVIEFSDWFPKSNFRKVLTATDECWLRQTGNVTVLLTNDGLFKFFMLER